MGADIDNAVGRFGRLSEDEWLAHFKKIADKSQRSASKLLRQYEKQINELKIRKSQPRESVPPAGQAQDFPKPTTPAHGSYDWRSEAIRIFKLADKDQNGQLDMSELADVRRSEEYAEAMMHEADIDNAVGRL